MNDIFRPYFRKFILVFFDDIFIYSKVWNEYLDHLRTTVDILRENQLKVKRSKCIFASNQIEYLSHLITTEGVRIDLSKLEAIQQWSKPTSLKQLRGFLGLTNYYRKFMRQYGMIARPLTDLLKKNDFKWNKGAIKAFQQLKAIMTTFPVLALPDFSKSFIVESDASGSGIGAVLVQEGRPLAFFSKTLSGRHLVLSMYEKEMMTIVSAVQKWRPYLLEGISL